MRVEYPNYQLGDKILYREGDIEKMPRKNYREVYKVNRI